MALSAGNGTIVGIFGPTHHKMVLPDDERYIPVQSELACSPCAVQDGNDPTTKCTRTIEEECLLSVSVDDVWAALEPYLSALKTEGTGGGDERA